MNQIILIGEAKSIKVLKNKNAILKITTKDYQKEKLDINVLIEEGYEQKMIDILKDKPLIAIKCALRKSVKDNVFYVAEKMSVLKLTEEK